MAVNTRSSAGPEGATRERIHDAALTLFNERGYTATTVRELAEACGLTPGALYNHYASKEALLFAIVDRVHDLADAVLAETLRRVDSDPAQQLQALTSAFTAFHLARPRETRVANRDYIHLPVAQRESVVRRRRRVRALFDDVLREGQRRARFTLDDLGSEDAVQAAGTAILNMVVFAAEWSDPAAPRDAQQTALHHGRLALRIAGAAALSDAASVRAPGRAGRSASARRRRRR